MTDVHSKTVRSYNMSRIKGKDTKPEIMVRKFLFANGFRYRLHVKNLPGKPDIVLPKHKTVVFVNGCFWHAHEGCKYYVIPKTRTDWWLNKLSINKQKDADNFSNLTLLGWHIIVIFECELKSKIRTQTLSNLINELH